MTPMRCWLTMGDDGKGVLTHRRPIIERVEGTNRRGVYARAGDMVLLRALCPESIMAVLGHLPDTCEPECVFVSLVPALDLSK